MLSFLLHEKVLYIYLCYLCLICSHMQMWPDSNSTEDLFLWMHAWLQKLNCKILIFFKSLFFFNLHYKIIHRVVTYKRPLSTPRTIIYNYYYEWFLVVSFCCILLLLLLLQFFWLFFCSLCLMFLLLIWVHYCQVSKKFKLPLLMIQIYKDTL